METFMSIAVGVIVLFFLLGLFACFVIVARWIWRR